MHIVLGLLGILGLIGGFVWRAKAARRGVEDMVDTAGRLNGRYRRWKFRNDSALSVLKAVDDPVVAAATVIFAVVAENHLVVDADKERLRQILGRIAEPAKAEEAVAYAAWACARFPDAGRVIDTIGPYLWSRLTEREKAALFEMLEAVAGGIRLVDPVGSERTLYDRRIRRLRHVLDMPEEIGG